MMAISSFGKPRFKTYEITDSKFIVVFEETEAKREVPVSRARLMNDGKTYEMLEIKNSYENSCNRYTLVFPRQNCLNNTEVELTIGTETFTEDVWKQIVNRWLNYLFGFNYQCPG